MHTAVAWGVALLCVWIALRWLGAKHEALTGWGRGPGCASWCELVSGPHGFVK